jgi:hypothetical protein
MAVPKDRVDHIGVSGERSLSFRTAVLLGLLDLEDEGKLSFAIWEKFLPCTQHHIAKYLSLQKHFYDNLECFKPFHRFQMAESDGAFQRSSSQI